MTSIMNWILSFVFYFNTSLSTFVGWYCKFKNMDGSSNTTFTVIHFSVPRIQAHKYGAWSHFCAGLFEMIVRVLTTYHTQYTWDSSIFLFLFNGTTLQVFVTYLTSALYVYNLWFYRHQHDNLVHSKLSVACQHTLI
jgi:hypothetical protein